MKKFQKVEEFISKRGGMKKISFGIFKYLLNFFIKLLKELGGISLFFAVITFFNVQYNIYATTANTIRADTGTNLYLTDAILSDKNKNLAYLHSLYDQSYNDNWNYIVQYYTTECFRIMREAALDSGSLNTIILQRQTGNSILNQDKLYEIATKLKPDFENILNCKLEPWWKHIFYKIF